MKASAPKTNLWIIALIIGILGILGKFVATIPVVTEYNYFFLLFGFILLALGTTFRGM